MENSSSGWEKSDPKKLASTTYEYQRANDEISDKNGKY
jgi:hypothetical protein